MSPRTASAQRVLLLTSNYPRWDGDSTTPFVHSLATDLVARDWQVTVLAPHAAGAERHEVMDGVEVRRFRYSLPDSTQTVCYGGGALVNLRESPGNKIKLPALVAAEWAATARSLSRGFDVLHAHWTLPQGFVAATTPYRRVPRVLTVHGGDVFALRGRMLDRFAARALRRADRVTVASAATHSAVREIAGPNVRLSTVPFGVDLSCGPRDDLVKGIRDRYRQRLGPLLVFVGRIVEEKGVLDVVDAVAQLVSDMPDVSAALVGSGQHVGRVREAAVDRGVLDRIHLPGWAEPADVPSWLSAADVVLAPSRIGLDGWTEGQGLTIVEAMAAGRPVIATATGGIPDTVTDGETGILVPPGDIRALADGVRRVVTDPHLAARLGERAAATARTRFDRSTTTDAITAIYREEIERRLAG